LKYLREYQKRVKEVNEIWDNIPFKNIEDIDDDQYDKEYQEAKKEIIQKGLNYGIRTGLVKLLYCQNSIRRLSYLSNSKRRPNHPLWTFEL